MPNEPEEKHQLSLKPFTVNIKAQFYTDDKNQKAQLIPTHINFDISPCLALSNRVNSTHALSLQAKFMLCECEEKTTDLFMMLTNLIISEQLPHLVSDIQFIKPR